jgi:hypothetical protein
MRVVIDDLASRRTAAEATRARQLGDQTRPPLLEPLLPALTCAVMRWGEVASSLSVVHDEQSAVTPARVAEMATMLDHRHPGHRLSVRSRADSRADPRIQVADWIAGTARRTARGVLAGHPDPELIAWLTPFVDPDSVWPHELTPLASGGEADPLGTLNVRNRF